MTHEIHEQPGGYVGHPFAGWLYHYALALAFYQGMSDGEVRHDETHYQIAARTQVPEDGKVRRILEIGCSDGRTTIALKERFPDAEVWGIDVGGPMVRYAHHRSVGLGLDINFAQRLAEDTHFPDNYFDLVVANLVFHEVAAFATKKIYPEIHRITRKGGVWSGDGEGGNRRRRGSIVTNAATWVNHRYNIEPWQLEWAGLEPNDLLNDAGFVIDRSGGRPILGRISKRGSKYLRTRHCQSKWYDYKCPNFHFIKDSNRPFSPRWLPVQATLLAPLVL